ncbi:unnamed protein product [Symbiodinium natans]|uniref:Uncharacterized protein n=1 Tax=Symbiodinium natans TaxID=878477 RepID=A0A812TIQ6_9DINO|nr:unnamed protein product [Symbiodinium natans]
MPLQAACLQPVPRPLVANWALASIFRSAEASVQHVHNGIPSTLSIMSFLSAVGVLVREYCGQLGAGPSKCLVIRPALDSGQQLSETGVRQFLRDLTGRCSVCFSLGLPCPSAQVLGATGPATLLPLQRKLLRRLAFDAGDIRGGLPLARLSVSKAIRQQLPCLQEVLLDVAELLNLRAYARTYVSSRPSALAELEEALSSASQALDIDQDPQGGGELVPLWGLPRARLMLARTLSSAAHSLALCNMQGARRERMLAQWTSPDEMFKLAQHQIQVAISEVSSGEHALFWQGILYAAMGESFFCQAVVREDSTEVVQRSLTTFQNSLRCFQLAGRTNSLQYADALKDYGKVLCGVDPAAGERALRASLHILRRSLGSGHPCTRNVCRLLDRADTDSTSMESAGNEHAQT